MTKNEETAAYERIAAVVAQEFPKWRSSIRMVVAYKDGDEWRAGEAFVTQASLDSKSVHFGVTFMNSNGHRLLSNVSRELAEKKEARDGAITWAAPANHEGRS